MNPCKELSVVSDVDETLVNSIARHVERLTIAGQQHSWPKIPTYDEVIRAGETHNAYKHIPEYPALNEQMRFDREFNAGLEPISGAIDAIPFLNVTLRAYLTTRPQSLAQLTADELGTLGFPDRQVICRPNSVDLSRTEEWKLWILMQLAQEVGGRVVMVDDNPKMHRKIQSAQIRGIESILFAGPITPPNIGAKNWKQIEHIVPKI